MSRLSTLSAAAIKAMFSSETDENLIMILTLYDSQDPPQPFSRLADGFSKRLTSLTTDDEVIYGVTHKGNDYVFLPMQINLPGELETGVSSCSIQLNYVTQDAITVIRNQLHSPVKVQIELILRNSSDSDNVSRENSEPEASFPGFYITSVSYSAESISLELSMTDYTREPFPCYNFIPTYFPGLF